VCPGDLDGPLSCFHVSGTTSSVSTRDILQALTTGNESEDEVIRQLKYEIIWVDDTAFDVGTRMGDDISANDLINDLKVLGKNAFFVEDRNDFLANARPHLTGDCVLLLMAARDPSLEQFARQTWQDL